MAGSGVGMDRPTHIHTYMSYGLSPGIDYIALYIFAFPQANTPPGGLVKMVPFPTIGVITGIFCLLVQWCMCWIDTGQ